MFVVGANLKCLIEQHTVVDCESAFDQSSLTLRLSRKITKIDPGKSGDGIKYGEEIPPSWIKDEEIPPNGILLDPFQSFLGCSVERIRMPLGYIGFLQTKGSLARLFVTVHCCDSQIDPGFNGHVTFEVVNLGPMRVRLSTENEVAQLFIAKTTTKEVLPYAGRYQNSSKPTIQQSRK